jgi:uncharacterized protein (TIGR00255 family)
MTGFSKTEINDEGITGVIEIKSLNGKYLEINCKLPRYLNYKELEIRELVRNKIKRGNITINVSLDSIENLNAIRIDTQTAIEYYNQLEELKKKLKIKDEITLEHILHFSNYLHLNSNDDNTELYWKVVRNGIIQGLKTIDKMRINEGKQIYKDIQNRIKNIKTDIEKIESLSHENISVERDKLRQRVAMLFENDEIDEQRLQMEIVLLADKLDISEECVRLKSHIKFFLEAFKSEDSAGRKLNFLIQEMHREINTIGVKASNATISQIVVEVKEELEKIREQVQNIE